MKFQPLGKRVLIQREEETKTTASGIIIPDNASKEKPSIVEIGKECEGVNIGDQVAFAKYSGSEITLEEDKKYLILNLEDVLGIIKQERQKNGKRD